MAPFQDALNVELTRKKNTEDGEVYIYTGTIDGEWCIGAVPNGGYVLALMIEACIQRQAQTKLQDPIHVSAHFLRTTAVEPFEIHVRILKEGRSFTNILVDLWQKNALKVTTHQVFGTLAAPPQGSTDSVLTLQPPSTYARRLPLYQHPSTAPKSSLNSVVRFASRLKVTKEPELRAKNSLDSPSRTNEQTIGGGGVEWGQWLTIEDKNTKMTPPLIAFFADMMRGPIASLPRSERTNVKAPNWAPTLTMTVEFKFALPPTSSQRTAGLYTNCFYFNDPQARHDSYTEVWSAPGDVGGGEVEVEEGWRAKQVCLAVAYQTALVVPMTRNTSKGSKL